MAAAVSCSCGRNVAAGGDSVACRSLVPQPTRPLATEAEAGPLIPAIDLIVGPMFAGKSTELLRRVMQFEVCSASNVQWSLRTTLLNHAASACQVAIFRSKHGKSTPDSSLGCRWRVTMLCLSSLGRTTGTTPTAWSPMTACTRWFLAELAVEQFCSTLHCKFCNYGAAQETLRDGNCCQLQACLSVDTLAEFKCAFSSIYQTAQVSSPLLRCALRP